MLVPGPARPWTPMFTVYRIPLRDPVRPPQAAIDQLREALADVEIRADGQARVFMGEDPDLGERVRAAVKRLGGDADCSLAHP
jgi:hypothetical protein